MISLTDYFGKYQDLCEGEIEQNATVLLMKCYNLWAAMRIAGVEFPVNPKTGSNVSGETLGGIRPQSCATGAPTSAHKQGMAVDIYDPKGEIDKWLLAHPDTLEKFGIYIEHPDDTPGWSHWSTRAPKSGRHIFKP